MPRQSDTVQVLLQELRGEADAALQPRQGAALVAEADRRDVAPLLYARLRARGRLQQLPPGALLTLEERYGQSALQAGLARHALQSALRGLAEDGLEVIVLKGAYLGEAVYGDMALRPMGDLDLLVRGGDVERAVAALAAVGYLLPAGSVTASRHHLPALRRPGWLPLELHHDLAEWSDPDGLWARAVATQVVGAPAFRLDATDLVLQLCLHVAHHHGWQGVDRLPLPLRSLFDVSLSIEHFRDQLDWDRFAAVANGTGRGKFALASLRVAAALAGARPPASVFADLGHDAEAERMAAVIIEVLGAPTDSDPPLVGYTSWRRAGGAGKQLAALWRTVFPPLPDLRRIYGLAPAARGAALFYLLRPFDLARRHGLHVLRLATGFAGGRKVSARERGLDQIDRWIRS